MATFNLGAIANREGISVIELLTVLVVIGIGASLATPSLTQYVEEMRTQHAMDQLVAGISQARLLAVREGNPSAFRMNSDGTYSLERLTPGGAWVTVRTNDLRDEFAGVAISGGAISLEFSSRGLVTNLSGDAAIVVTTDRSADSAFVSPAGRVYRDF